MHELKLKYVFFISVLLNSCTSNTNENKTLALPTDSMEKVQVTDPSSPAIAMKDTVIRPQHSASGKGIVSIKIVSSGTGFGYQLLMNGKPYISQMNIPAVQGIQYFSSEEKAAKVANFVKYKVEHDILPPSVSVGELDSLGALK